MRWQYMWGAQPAQETDRQEARFAPAFDAFYAVEYRPVLMLVSGLVRRSALAEDICQEAFARAYRLWPEVSTHPNPEAWVRRVAINLANSTWRRAKAEARALLRFEREASLPAPESSFIEVWRAVGSLPRRQREATVLFYVDGFSVVEIAGIMGVREGTVKATLHHARKRLAAELEVAL